MKTQTNRTARPRSAFTLLELVIVIAIIGMLSSLLFIGIRGALSGIYTTQVKSEFTQLELAITEFKSEYGVIPPSQIVLTENPVTAAWDPVSKSVLRRMFGSNFDFTASYDFNGDTFDTGQPVPGNGTITLTSSECLLFFLGGMRDLATGQVMTGFSPNGAKPFARGGANRTGPHYTFDSTRFIDRDSDGMPEYRDMGNGNDDEDVTAALIFASSNNGQGYSESNGSVIYFHQSDGTTAWNENSFQLISPGADGTFGFGISPNYSTEPTYFETWTWSPANGPLNISNLQSAPWNLADQAAEDSAKGAQLSLQRDNISNFSPGTMGE